MWLLYAFAAPVLWAVSTHIDKYLVDRYFHRGSVAVLLLYTAAAGLLLAPAVWLLRPPSLTLPLSNIAVIVASGVLSMGAMLFYLDALRTEEASSVAPWFQAAPLFGYVLGYTLLGEALSSREVLGGAIIVAGAVLLSLKTGSPVGGFNMRLAVLMLACAFTLTLSTAIFKLFAVRDEFWATMAWTSVGQVAFGLLLISQASVRCQLGAMLRHNPGTVLVVNAANEAINLGGSLAQRYALLFAPLGLVQAVGGTAPLFVYLFGIMLSVAAPAFGKEDISPSNLLRKASATVLVVTGVILISR